MFFIAEAVQFSQCLFGWYIGYCLFVKILLLMLIFVCIPLLQGDLFAIWNDSRLLPHTRNSLRRKKRDLLLPEDSWVVIVGKLCDERLYNVEKDCAAGTLNSRFCGPMTTFWQL